MVRRLLTLRNPDTVAGINAPNATNATLATWRCRASEVKARSSMSVGSKQAASASPSPWLGASHTKMQNHSTSETVFTGALMFQGCSVIIVGQEETNDDGERHINGHTHV